MSIELKELEEELCKVHVLIRGYIRDANRYRFLRESDNWHDDFSAWDLLDHAECDEFDAIIDAQIGYSEDDSQ